jgi:hypothetical protein
MVLFLLINASRRDEGVTFGVTETYRFARAEPKLARAEPKPRVAGAIEIFESL